MWKSVRLRARARRGEVNRLKSERRLEVEGDSEAVGESFTFML